MDKLKRLVKKAKLSQIDQFSLSPIGGCIGDVRGGVVIGTQVGSEAGGYGRCQRVVSYGRKRA